MTSRGVRVRAQVCGDSGVGVFPTAKRVKKGFHWARPVPVPVPGQAEYTCGPPRGHGHRGCAGVCLGHLCCVINVIVIGQHPRNVVKV